MKLIIIFLFRRIAITSSVNFIPMWYNGTGLCALDEPANRIAGFEQKAGECVPQSVLCALNCTWDVDCSYFNFHETDSTCDIFHSRPCNVTYKTDCLLYKVRYCSVNNSYLLGLNILQVWQILFLSMHVIYTIFSLYFQ